MNFTDSGKYYKMILEHFFKLGSIFYVPVRDIKYKKMATYQPERTKKNDTFLRT